MKKSIKETLPKGTLLKGKYTYSIEAPLGQGSFGITYRAKVILDGEFGSLETQKHVAIKEFFMKGLNGRTGSSLSAGSDSALFCNYLDKFRKEVVNLSNLHHPGIVRVLEAFSTNSTCYYVMEYISGGTLDEEINRMGKLSFESAYPLMSDICSALSYMHDNHMLHLDLKPGNIMLDAERHPKLIDFGLSKHYTTEGEAETTTSIGLGTPGYAPIEQAGIPNKDNLNCTMDVYALGGVFFKMLTGHTPPPAFEIINNRQIIKKYLLDAEVEECIITLVEHAMHPLKDQRIQTIDEFLHRLDECHQEPATIPEPTQSSEPEETKYSNSPDSKTPSMNEDEITEIIDVNGKISLENDKKTSSFRRILKQALYVLLFIIGYILLECCYLSVRYDNFSLYSDFISIRKKGKDGACNLLGFEIIEPKYDDVYSIGENLYRVELNDKYGIVDDSGKQVTELIYDGMGFTFYEGCLQVKMNHKYGYIDTYGKTIIPFIYEDAYEFREGLSAVKKDGEWGYIDSQGETVIPFIYEDADNFHKGFAEIKREGKYGRIDITGQEVVKPIYNEMDHYFSYGYREVQRDGKYGFINEDWDETVPAIYDEVGAHNSQYASVKRNDKWGRVELLTGKEVVEPVYESLGTYDYSNKPLAKVRRDGKWGYIDKNWNEVVKPIYDDISHWNGSIKKVKINGKYGLIDESFNEVLPIIYDRIYFTLGDDQLVEIEQNGKWGCIDLSGKVIIKPMYDHIEIGKELIVASIEGNYGYIDYSGKTIIPFAYDNAMLFSEGLGNVKTTSLWGAINDKNETVIPFIYDSIKTMYKGYAAILRDGKWGRIDSTGTVTVNPIYEKIDFYSNPIKILKNSKWGIMDNDWNVLVEPIYDYITNFNKKYDIACLNGKYGFVDKHLKEITKPIYDYIYSLDQYELAKVCLNGKYGLINDELKTIVKPEYEKIIAKDSCYLLYRDGDYNIYLVETGEIITDRRYNSQKEKHESKKNQTRSSWF